MIYRQISESIPIKNNKKLQSRLSFKLVWYIIILLQTTTNIHKLTEYAYKQIT